jgi:hypothetical protein
MANNFRRQLLPPTANFPAFAIGSSGNTVFLSKAGNDANAGTSPDAPVRTLAAAIATGRENIILGTGSYRAAAGISFNNSENRYLYADGTVVIDLQGATVNTGQGWLMDGIIMRNIGTLNCILYGAGTAGAMFVRSELNFLPSPSPNWFNSDSRKYGLTVQDCIVRNGRLQETYNQLALFIRCILLGCTLEHIKQLQFCDVAPDSKVLLNDNTLTETANNGQGSVAGIASANNIRGLIAIGSGGYQSLAAQQASVPAVNVGSISADPLYNRPTQEDYTLKLQSPHLNLGIGPAHLRFATSYYLYTTANPGEICTTANTWLKNTISEDFRVNLMSISGFTVNNAGGLVIRPNSAGDFEGFLQTEKIQISDVPTEVLRFGLIAGLNFDTDSPPSQPAGAGASASPDVFDNNVPAYTDPVQYGSGTAQRNPYRLSQQLRWCETGTPDNSAATGWKFGNTWFDFEINQNLLYNAGTLVGTGSADFNPLSPQSVYAKFFQVRLKTRNNYFAQ